MFVWVFITAIFVLSTSYSINGRSVVECMGQCLISTIKLELFVRADQLYFIPLIYLAGVSGVIVTDHFLTFKLQCSEHGALF